MTNDSLQLWLHHYADGLDYNLSSRVKYANWTQRPATNGIGTFSILLDNGDGNLFGGIDGDDFVMISVNNVEMFGGQIDKLPVKIKGKSKENLINISGRDTGQDLQNKLLWTLLAHTDTFSGKADDIIDHILAETSCAVLFTSPGTAPEMYYSADWLPLSEQVKEILESVDYTGFVDKTNHWQMWPISTGRDSGIIIKSLPGDATNNVVGDIEYEPGDTTDVRNYLIVQGPKRNKDAYSEMNAADWTSVDGTIEDYTATSPITPKAGVAALKGIPTDNRFMSFVLSFPKYWLWYLDWSLINSDDLKFSLATILSDGLSAADALEVRITDSNGRMMYWQEANVGYRNRWHEITLKIGVDESDNAKWVASGGFDKSLFTWIITDLEIRFLEDAVPGHLDAVLLDDLQFPTGTVAAVDSTGSTPVQETRIYRTSRPDIVSQVELQQFANQLAPKLNVAIPSLNLTAVGTAGLISGAWAWFPGYYATVQLKDALGNYLPANNSKWRFMELNHIFDPAAPNQNHIYTVELKMVPWDLVVDNQRWIYLNDDDPNRSAIRRVRDRLQYLERTQTTISEPQP